MERRRDRLRRLAGAHPEHARPQSLYNYTPYQPNAAALAAYPGTGDSCSAYGNRNFFFLFQPVLRLTGGGLARRRGQRASHVTIPDSPYVPGALRGAVVNAPNAKRGPGSGRRPRAIGHARTSGAAAPTAAQADQGCSRGGGSQQLLRRAPVGFDCSGLTAYVLTQAGFAIGTNSGSQRAGGRRWRGAEALAGDIVGFPGHVAVYLGVIDGVDYLLEAPTVGDFVQIRPIYITNGGSPGRRRAAPLLVALTSQRLSGR